VPPPRCLSYLEASRQKGENTCCTLHNIAGFVVAIVTPTYRAHDARIISDYHNLTSCWDDVLVVDSAQSAGVYAGAIDDQVCLLPRVMSERRFGDMLEDCSLEHSAILETLAN
jgi:hypothetical protein